MRLKSLTVLSAGLLVALSASCKKENYSAESLSVNGPAVLAAAIPLAGQSTVVYGESQHRVRENHAFAAALFRRLVANQGYRLLVLESSWRIQDVFAEYLATGNEELLNSPRMTMYANAFYSEELLGLFRWVREFNRAHPSDPVLISGFQPESPVSDLREVAESLQKHKGASQAAVSAVRASCALPESLQDDLSFVIMAGKAPGRAVRLCGVFPHTHKKLRNERNRFRKPSSLGSFDEVA